MPNDRNTLDLRLGRAFTALFGDFAEIGRIKVMLDDTSRYSDAILTAAPPDGYGYTQAEVSRIRAGLSAMTNLDKIGHAQLTQPAANDFWFDAKFLLGVQG
jgi:hypothetical protein